MAERTCIACGTKAEREDLLRVVLDPEGRPAIDFSRKLPGRGAYLCWRADCVGGSARPLRRAFRGRMETADPGWADGVIRRYLRRRIARTCGLLQRRGGLKSGAHTVQMALDRGWPAAGLLAADAGEDIQQKLRRQCGRLEIPILELPLTSEELGTAVGKGVRSVAVIGAGNLSTELEMTLQRSRGFL